MSVEKHFCNTSKKCTVKFRLPTKATNGGRTVKVVGDFNNWDAENGIVMKAKGKEYIAETELPIDETFQYRYLIDDRDWENDWDADAYFPTEFGVDNSVVDTHLEEAEQGLMHFVYK